MSDTAFHCPACHAHATPYPLANKDGYQFVGCRACGSAVLDPWPSRESIDTFIGDIDPVAVHVTYPDRRIESDIKILSKNIPAPVAGRKRLLDVNALQGYTVMAARKLGYDAVGLNMLEHMHSFAAKTYSEAGFIHETLQEYAARGEKADIIICTRAFSLQTDPDGFAAALKQILAPGGMIYLQEDDGNHFNTPRDLAFWLAIAPPLTPAIFSKKGVTQILNRHGLSVRKAYFTWSPYMRLSVGHKK